MKYLQGSFTVGGYSKEGRDNYDRIFGKKPKAPKCGKCDRTMVRISEAWFCSHCDYYKDNPFTKLIGGSK